MNVFCRLLVSSSSSELWLYIMLRFSLHACKRKRCLIGFSRVQLAWLTGTVTWLVLLARWSSSLLFRCHLKLKINCWYLAFAVRRRKKGRKLRYGKQFVALCRRPWNPCAIDTPGARRMAFRRHEPAEHHSFCVLVFHSAGQYYSFIGRYDPRHFRITQRCVYAEIWCNHC